jgi:hypothetical protein
MPLANLILAKMPAPAKPTGDGDAAREAADSALDDFIDAVGKGNKVAARAALRDALELGHRRRE